MIRQSAFNKLVLGAVFLLSNLFGTLALAQIKFKGPVRVIGTEVFVNDRLSNQRLSLYSRDVDIKAQLSRLSTGDFVTGTASALVDPRLIVEGLDFVGLRKILGCWTSQNHLFYFKNFTRLTIWPLTRPQGPALKGQTYTYSIIPGIEADWQIFIADGNEVQLGSLDFFKDEARITIFDPQSGEKKEMITLKKIQKAPIH